MKMLVNKILLYIFVGIRRVAYAVLYFLDLIIIRNRNNLVVLCYHDIGNNKWYHTVSKRKFMRQLDYLKNNFKTLKPEDIEKVTSGKKRINEPSFVLTFDDGFRGIYKIREKIKKAGIKPILFILADTRNANYGELEHKNKFLSKKEIKELIKDGWELGCHSATHQNLTDLSEQEMSEEIIVAKKRLEQEYSTEVKYFAYPRGRYNKKILSAVKRAEYKLSFSMNDGKVTQKTNKFLIPRTGVNSSFSMLDFKSSLTVTNMKLRQIIKSIIYSKSMNITKENNIFKTSIIQQVIMFFSNRLITKEKINRLPLPKTINDYKLIEVLPRPFGDDQYQFGIYVDSKGEKGIVKQWDGKRKDGDYFWLINEIKIYQGLDHLYRKYEKQIERKFSKIKIPGLIKADISETRVILFIEYLEGKTLDTIESMEMRMNAFQYVITYFQYISRLLLRERMKKYFSKRTIFHTSAILIYMFLRASVMYPKKIHRLLQGLIIYASTLPAMTEDNQMSFIHRDLTYMNVMVDESGKFGIIDFEVAVFTHPLHEITHLVTGSWRRDNFWQELYKQDIIKNIFKNKLQTKVYQGLTIYTAIHRLATSPRKDFNLHYSYLRHGLNLRKVQGEKYSNIISILPGANLAPVKETK